MHEELSLQEMQKEWHGTFRSYVIGFLTCFVLTSLSFLLVSKNLLARDHLVYAIAALAIVQAGFQCMFFLHIGDEAKPRWKLGMFFGMIQIVLIIGVGSLWIMYDLNERVMSNMAEEMKHD